MIRSLHLQSMRNEDLHGGHDEHALFQASTVSALLDGAYDGDLTFADLAYNPELGYYRLSHFPGQPNETTNENPETIHAGEWGDDWQAYIWADSDGYLHLLGEMHQVADLYQALGALLHHGQHDPEIISEDDPAWGQSFTMAEAVAEATSLANDVAAKLGLDPQKMQARMAASMS